MLEKHIVAEFLEVIILLALTDYQHIFRIVYEVSLKVLKDYKFALSCRHQIVMAVVELGIARFHDIAIHILRRVSIHIVPTTHIGPSEGSNLHIYIRGTLNHGIIDRYVRKTLIAAIQGRSAFISIGQCRVLQLP